MQVVHCPRVLTVLPDRCRCWKDVLSTAHGPLKFVTAGESDDGALFDWGIQFDESFAADEENPEPVVGCGSYWWGPQILETSEDCSSITALPLQDESEYVFSGTNTYGCTWDTTVTVAWLAPGCMDPEAFNYDEAAAMSRGVRVF